MTKFRHPAAFPIEWSYLDVPPDSFSEPYDYAPGHPLSREARYRRQSRYVEYHNQMERKYARGARYPWLYVGPDPPDPYLWLPIEPDPPEPE